ncbi:hypothetical protein J1605_022368 [Eschrichtius robustus]|uniref:Uncharacterized protein n=1 Tax=Eschrichtius robustus TaxID=9764 RepID=A0AB34HCQ5_ESCRO|nr:hypothetical protein J1605_022368 [Eschrichtius robustus]
MGAGRTEQGPEAPESRQPFSYSRPSACGGGSSGVPIFSGEGVEEEDGGGGPQPSPYLGSPVSFLFPLGSPKTAPPYASSHDALAMPGTVLGKEVRKGTPILARLG